MNAAAKLEKPHAMEVDKTGSRVRDMFSQIAPRYDLMNHLLSLGIDIRWRKKTLRHMSFTGSKPVLDCCTGTGDLALMIAAASAGKFDVVGTDFCEPMLELARKKSAKTSGHAKEIDFIEADTQAIPFDDNHFQAVTCAFGLRNVQDTLAGLREMVRVTEKGGQVGVLEFSQPTMPVLRSVYQGYFRHVLPRVGQMMARNDQSAYEYLPNSVVQFPSGDDFVALMHEAGLENCSTYPMTLGVASLYLGHVSR
ncbi:MAG: bifunctional demethylmenaquinone methyltransferase/2-methoxy-6-polyprenyl-1,4-benzoquinol methylase UbiE [Aureliella sp.]